MTVHRRARRALPLLLALFLIPALALLEPSAHAQDNPLRFGVRLLPETAAKPVSGRLLVFMTNTAVVGPRIDPGFGGVLGTKGVYLAAQEVTNWIPGRQVSVNPDTLAYPAALSSAPKGTWRIMAVLDRDHSFAYSGYGPGDIASGIVTLPDLDPAKAGSISLVLDHVLPEAVPPRTAGIEEVDFQSPMLSKFWGRPITMHAVVTLPPNYAKSRRRYPTVYEVPGFGSDPREEGGPGLYTGLRRIRSEMGKGRAPAMIHVLLDPHVSMGHSAFADSVNNGPWGTALVDEFIPYLEHRYRMAGPRGRFLTGHSSGGWSSLWLQVNYPDAFNGVWSTSPDPVDFRSFCGVNLAKNPPENMFRTPDQRTRNLVRLNGQNVLTLQDFVRFEQVTGEYGGQFQSFDAVFSPKGDDGRPMRLFDRQTGNVDPAVARAWEKYDIHRILADNWPRLGPKLRGKLHIVVGGADTFHLESSVSLLRDFLREVHSDATVTILPGRGHMDVYGNGLREKIWREMAARYR